MGRPRKYPEEHPKRKCSLRHYYQIPKVTSITKQAQYLPVEMVENDQLIRVQFTFPTREVSGEIKAVLKISPEEEGLIWWALELFSRKNVPGLSHRSKRTVKNDSCMAYVFS